MNDGDNPKHRARRPDDDDQHHAMAMAAAVSTAQRAGSLTITPEPSFYPPASS